MTGPTTGGAAGVTVKVDSEVSRLQAIVDRVRYDPVDDTWQMDAASQEHMDGLYQQAEEARAERDEARRVVARVNNNCADFAEALGLPRDSYGDQIIEAARQLRTEAMEVAESNKALRAELSQLREQIESSVQDWEANDAAVLADSQRVHEANERLTTERDAARAELAALRASAVTLPEDWREQIGTALLPSGSEATASAVDLIESWRAPTVGDTAPPQSGRRAEQECDTRAGDRCLMVDCDCVSPVDQWGGANLAVQWTADYPEGPHDE